jgi:cytochrome c oxidase assembly factor CtaG
VSVHALARGWSLDGTLGVAFLVAVVVVGLVYLESAARGRRLDRRGRAWPRARTACFLAGLVVLVVDLYSGIGTEADARLSVHMIEHMVICVVVAPLLVAGAPVRLALYSLPRKGRRRLARCLRSPIVAALTRPVGSVSLFSAVQRLAAMIMVAGGLPAFAIPVLRRLGLPQRQPLRPIQSRRAAA